MDSSVLRQARYIVRVARMLRSHVFSGLGVLDGGGKGCRHCDLSLAQFNLIVTVRNQGTVTLSELAGMLGVSPPSVSVMVERLVERGMLVRERSSRDRRKVIIRVSPDEEHHIAEIEERIVATFVKLLEELGPETARQWSGVLEQVEQVLQGRRTGERKP